MAMAMAMATDHTAVDNNMSFCCGGTRQEDMVSATRNDSIRPNTAEIDHMDPFLLLNHSKPT